MPQIRNGGRQKRKTSYRSRSYRRQSGALRSTFRPLTAELLEDRRMLATFTVTTLSDTGLGSLRAAIVQSNVTAGDDIVEFNRALDGGTISLTSGQITISDSVEIRGPRADLMAISANDLSRIFFIDDGDFSADESVVISDLELREGSDYGGLAGGGGGAVFSAENLTLDRVTIRDSLSTGVGGGIANREGDVIIANSAIHGNMAIRSGGGAQLTRTALGTVTISNSTISGNTSESHGGGIDFDILGGYASVLHSTISGNSAGDEGGGIRILNGRIHLDHSIVARNADNSDLGQDIYDLNVAADPNIASYSLIGDNSGTGFAPAPVGSPDANGNLIGTAANRIDPELRPLDAWGGFTQTRMLEDSSPAVDAGDPLFSDPLVVDQQGKLRSIDGDLDGNVQIDMGASELVRFGTQFGSVDAPEDVVDGDLRFSEVSLRERISLGRFRPDLETFVNIRDFPDPIMLTQGEILVTSNATIRGSFNSSSAVINAAAGSRIFAIDDGSNSTTIDVTFDKLTLQGGFSTGSGGAIRSVENLTIERSTFRNNAANYGGAIDHRDANLLIRESTITGNSSEAFGGGLSVRVDPGMDMYIYSSTIANNSAGTEGGGIDITNYGGAALLHQSTITGNVADADDDGVGGGGGVNMFVGSAFFENTVVAKNDSQSSSNPDVSGTFYLSGSLIGDNTDSGLTPAPVGSPDASGSVIGTGASPIDPQLESLALNGGLTETMALLPTSPAIDAGRFADEMYDQRGDLYPRIFDGNNDLIAEVDIGAFEYVPADVTLHVDVTDGFFDGIVTPGELSLPEAVTLSNIYAGLDTITFDETLNGSTITLTEGEMRVVDRLDILGLGADQLTISGNDESRIFLIDDIFRRSPVWIDGLHLTGGNADRSSGGAILSTEDLKITNSSLTGNYARQGGGAIWVTGGLELRNSSLTGNSTNTEGGAIRASIKIFSTPFDVENTTISGNSAGEDGGGVWLDTRYMKTATVRHSTIAENVAGGIGGGIFADEDEPLVVFDHSIVALNTTGTGASSDLRLLGATSTAGYSFIGSNDGTPFAAAPIGSPDANGNMIGTGASPINPDLAVLSFDGGPTLSHSPLPGSPVEDAGDPNFTGAPFFDQRGIPYDRVIDGRIDIGSIEFQALTPLDGDFNNDGDYDCEDVNMLTAQIASGGFALLFDILPDGNNDQLDLDAWLAEAGQVNLGLGVSYQLGDANLDGLVNGADFTIWSQHKFTFNSNWCDGNFDANGSVDGRDFLIWNANKSIVPAAVDVAQKQDEKEPTTNDRGDTAASVAARRITVDRAATVLINPAGRNPISTLTAFRRSDDPSSLHKKDRNSDNEWLTTADAFFATLLGS